MQGRIKINLLWTKMELFEEVVQEHHQKMNQDGAAHLNVSKRSTESQMVSSIWISMSLQYCLSIPPLQLKLHFQTSVGALVSFFCGGAEHYTVHCLCHSVFNWHSCKDGLKWFLTGVLGDTLPDEVPCSASHLCFFLHTVEWKHFRYTCAWDLQKCYKPWET